MKEQSLPSDLNAEESVLGSLLIDPDAITKIENVIKPEDFYNEPMRFMYQACVNLRSRRETIGEITLTQELKRLGMLELSGGIAKLNVIISTCPTSLDIEEYAEIVRRLSVSRQMIQLGKNMQEVGFSADPDTNKSIDKISAMLLDWKKSVIINNDVVMPKDVASSLMDLMQKYSEPQHTISWGFRTLDTLTSGVYPELIIVGARPSTGKTQIMIDIAESLALSRKKVLFCSAEMSKEAILERKISRELRYGIRELRRDGIPDSLRDKMADVIGVASETSICYMTHGCSSGDIYSKVATLKETWGLDIVFVDYLQILRDCWQLGKENKASQVGRVSKTLKAIVNDFNIPVVCASQLNRDLERGSGEGRKPILADLRESGDIEQDADIVFLLWRDMNSLVEAERNVLQIKMAKNRQLGDSPVVKLVWSQNEHRYYDCYQED